jgi:hypothetical protein
MNIVDLIEAAEAPLDVILPLDTDAEMQEYFDIYTTYES